MEKTDKKSDPSKLDKILLGLSFIILSVTIPIVQFKIDEHSSRLDNYKFLYQHSLLKHSLSVEKHDNVRFLSMLLKDKYIQEKHGDSISKIIKIQLEREKELLVDSLTSSFLYPESTIDDYRNLHQKHTQDSLENLRTIDINQFDKNVLKIKNDIEKDKTNWITVKILLYFLGTVFFLIPTYHSVMRH